MTFGSLLALCLVISSALATPLQIRSSSITLPIASKINATGGAKALISRDQARARALFAHGQAKANGQSLADVPVPVTDAGVNIQLSSPLIQMINNISLSNSTAQLLASVLVHTHSSWTLGVRTPGSVLGNPTNLVQTPETRGKPCTSRMAVVTSQARNVSFHFSSFSIV